MNPVAPWQHHRPWRNLNPGDLRPRNGAPQWPALSGLDNGPGGPFAIFPTRADGWASLGLWLLFAHDVMHLDTTRKKIAVFAPLDDNNPASYALGVEAKVGANADPHDETQREALAKAIAHWEDYQAEWPQAEVSAGMALSSQRWPDFLAAVRKGGAAKAAQAP